MISEVLIEKVKLDWKENKDSLFTVAEFFDGNNVQFSFAANACTGKFNIKQFADVFKKLEGKSGIEGVYICIVDDDILKESGWFYSDTAYVVTASGSTEIWDLFPGKSGPSEIFMMSDKEMIKRLNVKEGSKIYCLWWD